MNDTTKSKKVFLTLAWLFCLIGLSLSFYALHHQISLYELGISGSPCNVSDYFSCDRVARSEFSKLFDRPQGIWGVSFFAAMLIGLILQITTRHERIKRHLSSALFLFSLIGVFYCIRLFFVTVVFIKAVCLNCLGVHLSAYLLSIFVFLANRGSIVPQSRKLTALNLGLISGIALLILTGFPLYHSGLSQVIEALHQTPEVITMKNAKVAELPIRPWNPSVGDPKAPHTIVEFVDFTCPSCASFKKATDRIEEKFPGQVRVVFKHFPQDAKCNRKFPTTPHPGACFVANLAYCAHGMNSFGKFYEKIFDIFIYDEKGLVQVEKQVHLPAKDLLTCINSEKTKQHVELDIEDGIKVGASVTPALVIHNTLYQGPVSAEIIFKLLQSH